MVLLPLPVGADERHDLAGRSSRSMSEITGTGRPG